MGYSILANQIHIDSSHFDAHKILHSGQLFLFRPHGGGFLLSAGSQACYIETADTKTVLHCTDTSFFVDFFDLNTDYCNIYNALHEIGGIMAEAVRYGKGIRMLNQPVEPVIFSFIVSANNNIKRISKILFAMCESFGERKEFAGTFYYTFPSAERIASSSEQELYRLGCGYRAPYILRTARDISEGVFDIELPHVQDYESALKSLTKLSGVGKKVADCILLFGYRRRDVFPVDTWIEKVYTRHFSAQSSKIPSREAISAALVQKFGAISGYAQQYLFYYQREYGKIY